MSVNILEGALGYLIGPIEFAYDQGKGWRERLVGLCEKNNVPVIYLDPTNKLIGMSKEVDEEHERICTLKKEQKWDELSDFMYTIVRQDHSSVDKSDFVVCYIDPDCHSCGSYFELQSALTEKKPYFLIVKGGKSRTPSWLFGILDHNMIFDSVEEVVERLISLNDGVIPLSDRWVLFRKQIKEKRQILVS